MKELIIGKNEANQRADKFLIKYLSKAERGFIFKMIRKKNITLNDKKMTGSEMLSIGDHIKIFFSDETLAKFVTPLQAKQNQNKKEDKCIISRHDIEMFANAILYEDNNIILINKPAGMLSQKAFANDISANELLISYLTDKRKLTPDALRTFRPSVCNRLDRNTTGILIAGKSLAGLQDMAKALRDRTIHKYYLCLVNGVMTSGQKLDGYLWKNEKNNTVTISETPTKNATRICTVYEPIANNETYSLLRIQLVTGKPHQIRAHLASIGHAIAGDTKYGDKHVNELISKKYHVHTQLLHAYELDFSDYKPENDELKNLTGKLFRAKLPGAFRKVLIGEDMYGNME